MNLTNLRKIAEAATPGPWDTKEDECNGKDEAWCYWHRVGPFSLMGEKLNHNDRFIATFNPAMILKLLAVVEAGKESIGRMSEGAYREMLRGEGKHNMMMALAALEEET
jgi:hypothetical protein